jgi:hypothetical protein
MQRKQLSLTEEQMLKKNYDLNGNNFRLKEDFTLEESEIIQNLIQGFYEEGNNYTSGIKKFLSLVLQPDNPEVNTVDFDFGPAKESVAREIIRDFFLSRLKSAAAMTDYLNSLMKEFSLPVQG